MTEPNTRHISYPGLNCGIPSSYYSFTFAPNADRTRVFPPGGEIRAYLRGVAVDLGFQRHIRFGAELADR